MTNIDMLHIIEINNEIAEKIEKDNRDDVVNYANEIAENIGNRVGKEVNYETVMNLAVQWFEKHKNHVEEFAEELMEFGESFSEMLQAEAEMQESSIWLFK